MYLLPQYQQRAAFQPLNIIYTSNPSPIIYVQEPIYQQQVYQNQYFTQIPMMTAQPLQRVMIASYPQPKIQLIQQSIPQQPTVNLNSLIQNTYQEPQNCQSQINQIAPSNLIIQLPSFQPKMCSAIEIGQTFSSVNSHQSQNLSETREESDGINSEFKHKSLQQESLNQHEMEQFDKQESSFSNSISGDNQSFETIPLIDQDSEQIQLLKKRLGLLESTIVQIIDGKEIEDQENLQINLKNIPASRNFSMIKIYQESSKRWSTSFECNFQGCCQLLKKWGLLVDHLRTHTQEKPYPCPVDGCGMKFSQKGNLDKHMKTHKRFYLKCCECKAMITKNRIIKHHQEHVENDCEETSIIHQSHSEQSQKNQESKNNIMKVFIHLV
eukprot:403373951